jgi:uncharacterized protein (DUF2252 family)
MTDLTAPTLAERTETGRAARKRAPRRSLGAWEPPPGRPDCLSVLAAQEPVRLPELLALRYGRMVASPWAFYRGAAAVMAADLATRDYTGLTVQLCGDAHLLNFGLWATPERNLAFDLRDFDETLPGPFEWDVKRLVASIVVLARHNRLGDDAGLAAVRAGVDRYVDAMATYAGAGSMDVWYDRIDVDDLIANFDPDRRANLSRLISKRSARRTSLGALAKFTATVDGQLRIVEDPPRFTHITEPDRKATVVPVFNRYLASLPDDRSHFLGQFGFVDTVRQVVGVGSVGMRVHLVLLDGRGGDIDPLFLQAKQATASVYEPYLGPSRYANHGARVVNGQRLIQSASDMLLGWTDYDGVDYYVRQFRDMKVIPDSDEVGPVLDQFAAACGATLAKAHARSGDPLAIATYLGGGVRFGRAMAEFAVGYADQTDRDHARLAQAVADGQIAVADG